MIIIKYNMVKTVKYNEIINNKKNKTGNNKYQIKIITNKILAIPYIELRG